jgi:hypothetical protein
MTTCFTERARAVVFVLNLEYLKNMADIKLDHPVAMTEEEDAATLAAIDEAAAQLDAGEGIPLGELRKEISQRCSK